MHIKTKAWERYTEQQKHLKKSLKVAEQNYVSRHLSDALSTSPKAFFSFFKARRQDTTNIAALKKENTLVTSSAEKADILNQQFQSAFTKENMTLPQLQDSPYQNISPLTFDTQGIYKLLSNLNCAKATGPDGISPWILKLGAEIIAPIYQALFTRSLRSGILPFDWLTANINPLFKSGDRTLASNYRPISITSIPCKIMEHIVAKHIMNHLDKYNILSDFQHGFRSKRSCDTQLLTTYHEISVALNNQDVKQVDAIVLDFAKAFDKVPHKRLLMKLKYYGITGPIYSWIRAFLSNRTQHVVIDGIASDSSLVTSGVPQGTVLGPILFLIYINDLPESLKYSSARLFADDSLIFRIIKTFEDCILLQKDLEALEAWENMWQMQFRPDKCSCIRFTRSHNPILLDYYLKNVKLNIVKTQKYLGVYLSSDMRWTAHIDHIVNKGNRTLGFLTRNLYRCPPKVKYTAYVTIVRPILDYCDTVWDTEIMRDKSKLEKLNTRAARLISNDYRKTEGITSYLKREHNLDILAERRKLHRLTFLYKISNGIVAIDKDKYLQYHGREGLRQNPTWTNYSATSNIFKSSFFPKTISEWNNLPNEIRQSPTLGIFVSKLSALNKSPQQIP